MAPLTVASSPHTETRMKPYVHTWLPEIALVLLLCSGCGATPQQTARHFVDGAGEVLVVTDAVAAQAYTERARTALDASSTLAEYHAAMAPLDAVEEALRTAAAALRLADAAVLIWDQGGVSSWPQAFGCAVGALVGVRDLLVAAGITLPPELVALLDGVHSVVDTDQCFTGGT